MHKICGNLQLTTRLGWNTLSMVEVYGKYYDICDGVIIEINEKIVFVFTTRKNKNLPPYGIQIFITKVILKSISSF